MSAPVKKCEITPLEALLRLIAIASMIDTNECKDELIYNTLQGEIAVAKEIAKALAAATVAPVEARPVVQDQKRLSDMDLTHAFDYVTKHWAYLRNEDISRSRAYFRAGYRYAFEVQPHTQMSANDIAAPSLEAQPAGEVARDAARYRWLIAQLPCNVADALQCSIGEINDEIDAAMAQGEK